MAEFNPGFDSKSDIANTMEYPLCPTFEEMGLRMKSKAKAALAKARNAEHPLEAKMHFEDALSYRRIAKAMFDNHAEVVRTVKWGTK